MPLQVEESIYNLIPRDPPKTVKGDRHKSKFKDEAKNAAASNRYATKTIGPLKVSPPNPNDFLKKNQWDVIYGTGKPSDPDQKFQRDCDEEIERKPPVPRQADQPVMGIRTTKNFITTNAVENIMGVARKPENNFVDTRKGDKQELETSGLYPKYMNKREYGKTPVYLKKRQEEMTQAQADYDAYIAEHFRRGAMMRLSEHERHHILEGLKTNWEELHHVYQGLSVVTDTAPKKHRKEKMEAEMKQLEKDIEMIQRHSVIYIAN